MADGFDSFEECLTQELPQDDETETALKRGLDVMYRAAQERIDEHFGRFAEHCAGTCFAVPKELLQARDLAENLPAVLRGGGARALDEQLRALRKRLAHASAMRAHCDAQRDALQAEMADHARVVEQLRLGKENAALGGVTGGKRGVEGGGGGGGGGGQAAPAPAGAGERRCRGGAWRFPAPASRRAADPPSPRSARCAGTSKRRDAGAARVHQLEAERAETRRGGGRHARG